MDCRLRYEITENPSWRSSASSEMIKDVVRLITDTNPTFQGDFMDKLDDYARQHAIQDQEDLDRRCSKVAQTMKMLYDHRMELMKDGSVLRYSTVPLICEIHRSLVDRPDAGNFRVCEAYTTRPDNSRHDYPTVNDIEHLLYGVVDVHNQHMEFYYKKMNSETLEDKLTYIIKCAAWFFCRVISVHPFGDGNGRVCRLLANDVLMELTPFPVQLYNVGNVTRNHYFNAIVQSQDDYYNPPCDLSAILVDGLWYGWKDYIAT